MTPSLGFQYFGTMVKHPSVLLFWRSALDPFNGLKAAKADLKNNEDVIDKISIQAGLSGLSEKNKSFICRPQV